MISETNRSIAFINGNVVFMAKSSLRDFINQPTDPDDMTDMPRKNLVKG